MELDEMIAARAALRSTLAVHDASIQAFWPKHERPGFVIDVHELESLPPDPGGSPLHMTSSATCFESLADREPGLGGALGPGKPQDSARAWFELAAMFAARALRTGPDQWLSDGAAHVYCRVRTLPAVLRFAPRALETKLRHNARQRLIEAFRVIDEHRELTERGLGERVLDERGKPDSEDKRYRANGFHAYWGAKAQREYERQRPAKRLLALPEDHRRRVDENGAWAQGAVAWHTALLLVGKNRGDAHQLAFALLADLLSHKEELTPASSRYDLYHAALGAFFASQEPSGRWPQSAPLFHYPHSGNAYCYTYETLAELLRPALPRDRGRVFRSMLEPYLAHLFRAWDYAIQTRVPLTALDGKRGEAYGWCSNHHLTRDDPEAWATAEAFAFGQLLRCVSGHIVAERCETELRARPAGYDSPLKAANTLASRGASWAPDGWTVGRQLASLFHHPTRLSSTDAGADTEARDPDASLIAEQHARSAVLFGPPGTSKTTLVEALAGALGWQYVEILASDFLSAGVDAVPARADHIFDRLMQMNRCVVLFDEIDELIRDRRTERSDPFGRFLTTSMLPKIAKLWKQRRIIFFVATNHIKKADPAITRSSRFDARIFVAPPDMVTKKSLFPDDLAAEVAAMDERAVVQTLTCDEHAFEGLSAQQRVLVVLPLLRYDQVPELIRMIRDSKARRKADPLFDALEQLRSRLLEHEWQPADAPGGWKELPPDSRLRYVYHEFLKDHTRDESRQRVITFDKDVAGLGRKWTKIATRGDSVFAEAPDALPAVAPDGQIVLDRNGRRATDQRFLHFTRDDRATTGA